MVSRTSPIRRSRLLQRRSEERVVHRLVGLPGRRSVAARSSPTRIRYWTGGFHGSYPLREADRDLPGRPQAGRPGLERHEGCAASTSVRTRSTDLRNTTQTFGVNGWFNGAVVGPGAGTAVLIDQDWFEGDGSGFSGPSAQNVEDGTYTKLREIGAPVHASAAGGSRTISDSRPSTFASLAGICIRGPTTPASIPRPTSAALA